MDELMQKITLYHKTKDGYVRYSLIANLQGTSIINRNNTGVESTDKYLAIIFDDYNNDYEVQKDDIVVNKNITTEIIDKDAPLTELQKLYGKDNVFKIKSIDVFRYKNIQDVNHIEIGLI